MIPIWEIWFIVDLSLNFGQEPACTPASDPLVVISDSGARLDYLRNRQTWYVWLQGRQKMYEL